MKTDQAPKTTAASSRLDRGVERLEPERDDKAATYLASALLRYSRGTGCTYPARACDYCTAFVAGWNGDTSRDTDSDVTDAKRRGAVARKRFDRSKTPNARGNAPDTARTE